MGDIGIDYRSRHIFLRFCPLVNPKSRNLGNGFLTEARCRRLSSASFTTPVASVLFSSHYTFSFSQMVPSSTSSPTPSARGEEAPPLPILAVLFVALFGVLLASFPARNSDIWRHLADGREFVSRPSQFGPTWLFDLTTYAVVSAFGGAALVAVKALLCGAIAILVLQMSRAEGAGGSRWLSRVSPCWRWGVGCCFNPRRSQCCF